MRRRSIEPALVGSSRASAMAGLNAGSRSRSGRSDGCWKSKRWLEPDVGALLVQALSAAREALYQRARAEPAATRPDAPSGDAPTTAQQQADALALLAETALHQGLDPAPRASATRWWSTSTPRCWPIRISRGSPSSRTGRAFPRNPPCGDRHSPSS